MQMKRFVFAIVFLVLVGMISGCSLGAKKEITGRQTPEVMLASDCGFDKLKCCQTEPACSFGQQCCIDPNDPNRNYCAEDCSCGDIDEFCCSGNLCNGKNVCYKGICLACGEKGQVCCQNGEECQTGLVCQKGECVECGVKNGPCCPVGEKCPVKEGQRAECINNICLYCGFDGNSPCTSGDKCLKGQIFAGRTCERCGQANQPCCNENSGIGYECDPVKGLKCELGFCAIE